MPAAVVWTLCALAAYLLGAIPFGLVIGRAWKGVDIRRHGSGNLGATNALRVLGKKVGAVVLLLDAAKGALPVLCLPPLLARLGAPPPAWLPALLAGLAVLGHVFPVYLRFRGGKGVATSAGAFGALAPAPFAVALGVFALTVALTRFVSLGSVLAALALPLASILLDGPRVAFAPDLPRTALLLAAALLVILRHRANLARLLHGQEPRLGAPRPTEPQAPEDPALHP